MWDPASYLRYADERGRPFGDLVGRVPVVAPNEVVDLGCGPGPLTVDLTRRWPTARIRGLDSSAEMIATARELGSTVEFQVANVQDWHPGPHVEVVLANAVLQWVPGHVDLLTRWVGELPPGAFLAFQVPGNFTAPSHLAIRAVAETPRWRGRVAELLRDPTSVLDPAGYATLLTEAGCGVDAWETTYLHVLPMTSEHPVLTWVEGTALRPVRAELDDQEWGEFRAELRERLAAAYPVHNGLVFFPFRRIFCVAQVS